MPFNSQQARAAFFAKRKASPGPNAGVPFQGNSAPPLPTLPKSSMAGLPGLPNQTPSLGSKPRFKQLSSLIKSPLGKPQF